MKSYFFEGLDDSFGGFFVLTFDFGHDFLVEFVFVLLSFFPDEEFVFDGLEFFLEELSEFEGVVFYFLFEDQEFFVEVLEVLAEAGMEVFDLFGMGLG
jgi:hypothetical protein